MSETLGPKPTKAYKSSGFINSRAARSIRIQCELQDAEARIKQAGINGSVLFFGSARSRTEEQYEKKLAEMKAAGEDTDRFEKTKWMCESHDRVTEVRENGEGVEDIAWLIDRTPHTTLATSLLACHEARYLPQFT